MKNIIPKPFVFCSRLLAIVAVLVTAFNASASATVYDVSADFSTTQNPNGVWTYGYKTDLNGALTAYQYTFLNYSDNAVPIDGWLFLPGSFSGIFHNGTTQTAISDGGAGTFPPGTIWFYPGFEGNIDNYGAIRFTVPTGGAGVYSVAMAVKSYLDGPISGDTDFHVVVNGIEVFGQFLPGNGSSGYTNSISLNDGGTIDFLVGRGADGSLYASALKIAGTITAGNH